jgi:hypothetical protein
MKNHYVKVLALIAIAVTLASLVPLSKAQSSDSTVTFLVQSKPDSDTTYKLTITIPASLYQYYASRGGLIFSDSDFAKFVTPDTLKPVADQLWQICNNSEDFTNAVLMLVHQINYREIVSSQYPVQTLVDGTGDCDLFANIAASILQAGGINCVLIYYKDQSHMQLGVQLPQAPVDGRVNVVCVTYQNIDYYIGECTGSQWRTGWRVGECSKDYQDVSAVVIPLPAHEPTFVGQVGATIRPLDSSTLSLQVSSGFMLENNQVTISGQILPAAGNENVTLKAKINSDTYTDLATVATSSDGSYQYVWTPPTSGLISVQASWVGNNELNGAKSGESSLTVLPLFVIGVIGTSVLAIAIVAVAVVRSKHKKRDLTPPNVSVPLTQPPPPPTTAP